MAETVVGPSLWCAAAVRGSALVIVDNVLGVSKMTANKAGQYSCTGTRLHPNVEPAYNEANGIVTVTYLGWWGLMIHPAVLVARVSSAGNYHVDVFRDTGGGVPGEQLNVDAEGAEVLIQGIAPWPRIVWA